MKNSGSKQTFLLYKDRRPLVDACSAEQAGELFKGIYAYVCGEGAPTFTDPLLTGIFEMFRMTIDKNDEDWAEKKNKAKKSAKARWETQKQDVEPERQEESVADHTGEAADMLPEKPAEDPERKTGQEPKPKQDTPAPNVHARTIFNACLMAYPISKDLQAVMESWLKYKTERRESYKEQGLRALMKKAYQSEKEYGTSAVIGVIEESMANRYQGITWDRIGKGKRASPGRGRPAKANQFTQMEQQQDYDFDALEKELSG